MVVFKCFAPLCTSRHGEIPKCFFFGAPKKDKRLFDEWQRAIPRRDKELSKKDYLCEKHFQQEDILRVETVMVNGEANYLHRKRPKLREGAVPCIWPNCPKYLTKEKKKTRKPPRNRNISLNAAPKQYKGKCLKTNDISGNDSQEEIMDTEITTGSVEDAVITPNIEKSQSAEPDINLASLPNGWCKLYGTVEGPCVFSKTVVTDQFPFVTHPKMCKFDFRNRESEFYLNSKPCAGPDVTYLWNDPSQLSSVISNFDHMIECPGIQNGEFHLLKNAILPTGQIGADGIWRSKKCLGLGNDGKLCSQCASFNKVLKIRLSRLKINKSPHILKFKLMTVNDLQNRLSLVKLANSRLRAQLIRISRKLKKDQESVKSLRKEVSQASADAIENLIKSLDPKEGLTVKMIVRRSKVKNKKSMRFEAEWILECLLLHIKSPSAYKHIQDSGILPLPSPSTLRRLIRGLACHFGFQKMALEAVRMAFANKAKQDVEGVVSFDELAVMEEMSFDAKDHIFKGFAEQVQNEEETDNTILEEVKKAGLSEQVQINLGLIKEKKESNTANVSARHEEKNLDQEEILDKEENLGLEENLDKEENLGLEENLDQEEILDKEENLDKASVDSSKGNETNIEPGSSSGKPQDQRNPHPPDSLADHALVFMYRPLHEDYTWVQPFGVFASCNALPGDKIHILLMKALVLLEHSGATVSAVVSDGAQGNKTVWKHCGIGNFVDGELINKMNHPTNPEKSVRFLLDPPHAFKCIRNQMCKEKNEVVQFAGEKVSWKSIINLYNTDILNPGCLRVCRKIKEKHIRPNNFQKMSVKGMAVVFSRTCAAGLKIYRLCLDPEIAAKFKDSEPLEKLILLLDAAFDAMNGRSRHNAIRKESKDPRYQWDLCEEKLKEFDHVIEETLEFHAHQSSEERKNVKTFASLTTLKGLRVTIKTVREIVNNMFAAGRPYVLTGRLNQDCLERFFGLIRAAGGSRDKPTCTSFQQLFRLLTLYYPTKATVRGGNIEEYEKIELLSSYSKWLLSNCKAQEAKYKNARKLLKDVLLDGIMVELQTELKAPLEKGASINDNIVYYIGGYMARTTSKRRLACKSCAPTLGTFEDFAEIISASDLTRIKNVGKLTFSTTNLFLLLSQVERSFLEFYETGRVFERDAFHDILENIVVEKLPPIGCSTHRIDVMTNVIYDYLLLRFKSVAKAKTDILLENKRTASHASMKLSKMSVGPSKLHIEQCQDNMQKSSLEIPPTCNNSDGTKEDKAAETFKESEQVAPESVLPIEIQVSKNKRNRRNLSSKENSSLVDRPVKRAKPNTETPASVKRAKPNTQTLASATRKKRIPLVDITNESAVGNNKIAVVKPTFKKSKAVPPVSVIPDDSLRVQPVKQTYSRKKLVTPVPVIPDDMVIVQPIQGTSQQVVVAPVHVVPYP